MRTCFAKPSLLIDLLITGWVAFVATVFYGGYFFPNTIGVYTGVGVLVYAVLLLLGVLRWAYGRLFPHAPDMPPVTGGEDGN